MKKILIAEDDPDTMDLIEIVLHQAGYAVIKINRPVLLREVGGIKPELIILDYLMPHRLGSDICRELKNDPRTKSIPIILFSASHGLPDIAAASGADDFIAKPFVLDQFLGLVAKWVL